MVTALLLPAAAACAHTAKPLPKVGAEYEIIRSYETAQETNGESSGSSRGRDGMLERVIGLRDGGLELEYDLPANTPAEHRARVWQFPVRVFKPASGPMQLIDRSELDARVDAWLAAAGLTRAACGEWIFTWNAFHIECDPETIIQTIHSIDLRSIDLREGTLHLEPEARGPGKLTRAATGPDGARFVVALEIDPDAARRDRAEADVIAGEIMQKPVTIDAALRERAKESVSGTIEVTFEADSTGTAWRRIKVTRLRIDGPGDRTETQIATETVERRPVSGAAAHP